MSGNTVWARARQFFLLSLFLLPALFLWGFTPASYVASNVGTKQVLSSGLETSHHISSEIIKVQKGVFLEVLSGEIVAVDIRVPITNAEQWQGLIGSKYVIGDVHASDVTPLLWRKLEVQLHKRDNSIAEISMLRPLWWLQLTRAREGGYLDLHAPEAGLEGKAYVLRISKNTADSRGLGSGENLVISTIKHHDASVLYLSLKGQAGSIGVTPNHLIFSFDRKGWTPAGKLIVDERLGVYGENRVQSIKSGTAKYDVFNIEVHRAKSYFVSSRKVLAHNANPNCNPQLDFFEKHRKNALDIKGGKLSPGTERVLQANISGARTRKPVDGYTDFFAHGVPNSSGYRPDVLSLGAGANIRDVGKLEDVFRRQTNYDGGKIRAFVCGGGSCNLLQGLSSKLGVEMIAPRGHVRVDRMTGLAKFNNKENFDVFNWVLILP